MRGILITESYATKIINRKKKTECRNYKLPNDYLHTPIYLLNNGRALAVIHLSLKSQSENSYRYKIVVHTVFNPPLEYKHPKGAQLYVKNVKLIV